MVLDEVDFKNLSTAKVLVAGDCMLDRYWIGDVNRISPEAPVPVVAVTDSEERLGGAANVALNISEVGGQAHLASIVGEDEAGQSLQDLLSTAGIASHLAFDASICTTVKLRMVSRNQQLVRADFEDTPQAKVIDQCYAQYSAALEHCDAVILSDYGKGGLRQLARMIESAAGAGKPVFIDPKGYDFSQYQAVQMITPNLTEFQQVVGTCEGLDDIGQKAQILMQDLNIQQCLVTLSENGMLLCERNKPAVHQETRAREVYDVTGAGDTVIAMMALGAAAKLSAEKTLELANHAAGVVVNKMGTATANQQEIMQSIQRVKAS